MASQLLEPIITLLTVILGARKVRKKRVHQRSL